MNRDTMLFYNEWRKAISELSIDKRCEVYEALFDYAFENKLPEDSLIKAITHIMRIKIDSDQEHYQFKCQKNRENAKKGGRPKKEEKTERFLEKPFGFSENRTDIPENRTKPNETEQNPYMIYDNMIYDDKDKSLSNIDANASTSTCVDAKVGLRGKKEEIDWERFKEYFNSELEKHNSKISRIAKLTKERKTYINARIKEYGKEAIVKVVEYASSSPFLNGAGDRAFVASFDWLFRPRNFPKVLEGTYNRPNDINSHLNSTTHVPTPNFGFNSSNYQQRQTEFARHIADKLNSPCPEQPDIDSNY